MVIFSSHLNLCMSTCVLLSGQNFQDMQTFDQGHLGSLGLGHNLYIDLKRASTFV